jgi:hypothetical protein
LATQRKLDTLIQKVTDDAVTECRRLHPDNIELDVSEWVDVWHNVSLPIELEIRRRLNRLGISFERWAILEDDLPEYSISHRKIWKKK